jgi:dihydrofolate reductase
MRTITVTNHLSLDGVMQAPARPDEDTSGGFAHGGWAMAGGDEVMARFLGERVGAGGEGALVLGRRTYEDFYAVWPKRADNPFTDVLNRTQKYVASRTLAEPLPWENSTLLPGDAAEAVAALKQDGDAGITILGSGTLVQSLLAAGLIDRFVLMIHPIVLGSGQRLFADDGAFARLRLIEVIPTTTGVLIATYETRPTSG